MKKRKIIAWQVEESTRPRREYFVPYDRGLNALRSVARLAVRDAGLYLHGHGVYSCPRLDRYKITWCLEPDGEAHWIFMDGPDTRRSHKKGRWRGVVSRAIANVTNVSEVA